MKTFIIDGNNLIGKDRLLTKIQGKDRQAVREKLAFMLDNYFHETKNKIYLHFDGFENEPIKTSKVKIIYSNNKIADDKIRKQIENSKNAKNITVITSDGALKEFAKVCRCSVIDCEDFSKELNKKGIDEEKRRIDSINNNEEFKKLFGVK